MEKEFCPIYRSGFAFLLLSVFILVIYSNTLDASWHLDDYHNITKNPWVRITDLSPDLLIKSLYAGHDGGEYKGNTLFRPVPMLTFALNWYIGQKDVTGYHIVNIGVHIITAFFLFLTVYKLLETPNITSKDKHDRYQIALLCAVLWAIHPIQIQAVTYIVQRMASMAGMFYVAGLYFYLKARECLSMPRKIWWVFLCVIMGAFAFCSKENSVLFPFSIVLVECLFFQDLASKKVKKWLLLTGGALLVLLFFVVFYYFDGKLFGFLKGYGHRPFSFVQRLLTEPRVICFYLYQIFYPASFQFSIEHDILVSTSFFSPWTTLPAIGFLILLLTAGAYNIIKRPIWALAIFFFFLNHIVESTIFPLELIFEHRNYIPTMFLFLPFIVGLVHFFESCKYKNQKKILGRTFLVLASAMLTFIAFGTYTRNFDWKTEASLWESAMQKAPNHARTYHNIASFYYQQTGQYDKAIDYHKKALDLKAHNPALSKMISYDNLRDIFIKKNKINKALEYSRKALNAKPAYSIIFNHIEVLVMADEIELAHRHMAKFLTKKEANLKELNMHTLIQLKRKDYEKAYDAAIIAFKKDPFNVEAITYLGYTNMYLGRYNRADHFLSKATHMPSPALISIYIALIENSIKQGNEVKKNIYLSKLFEKFSAVRINEALRYIKEDPYPELQVSLQRISNEVCAYMEKIIDETKVEHIVGN